MSSAAGSFLTPETIEREVERQRTFAIISHPDAGKTTLTEKILLYAGAIELAGAVRGRKTAARRRPPTGWTIERERGISITSTALEFELLGCHVTLLDTPGHKDFSEDTYRTLLAVDSVVMVIDAAKGIEPQTRKLFEVCRQRQPADADVRQQDGSAEPRSARAARRNRKRAGRRRRADELADRRRRSLPRRLRPAQSRSDASTSASAANGAASGARPRKWPIAGDPALVEMLGDDAARGLLEAVELLADGRHRVRFRGLPRRAADGGLLRQRDLQLRSRAVPARHSPIWRRLRRRGPAIAA